MEASETPPSPKSLQAFELANVSTPQWPFLGNTR